MIKYIRTLKIHVKLNTNFYLTKEKTQLKHFNDPKAFIEYSNDMQDVYKSIVEYITDIERKILIVFDDMIADMIKIKFNNSRIVY